MLLRWCLLIITILQPIQLSSSNNMEVEIVDQLGEPSSLIYVSIKIKIDCTCKFCRNSTLVKPDGQKILMKRREIGRNEYGFQEEFEIDTSTILGNYTCVFDDGENQTFTLAYRLCVKNGSDEKCAKCNKTVQKLITQNHCTVMYDDKNEITYGRLFSDTCRLTHAKQKKEKEKWFLCLVNAPHQTMCTVYSIAMKYEFEYLPHVEVTEGEICKLRVSSVSVSPGFPAFSILRNVKNLDDKTCADKQANYKQISLGEYILFKRAVITVCYACYQQTKVQMTAKYLGVDRTDNFNCNKSELRSYSVDLKNFVGQVNGIGKFIVLASPLSDPKLWTASSYGFPVFMNAKVKIEKIADCKLSCNFVTGLPEYFRSTFRWSLNNKNLSAEFVTLNYSIVKIVKTGVYNCISFVYYDNQNFFNSDTFAESGNDTFNVTDDCHVIDLKSSSTKTWTTQNASTYDTTSSEISTTERTKPEEVQSQLTTTVRDSSSVHAHSLSQSELTTTVFKDQSSTSSHSQFHSMTMAPEPQSTTVIFKQSSLPSDSQSHSTTVIPEPQSTVIVSNQFSSNQSHFVMTPTTTVEKTSSDIFIHLSVVLAVITVAVIVANVLYWLVKRWQKKRDLKNLMVQRSNNSFTSTSSTSSISR